MMITNNDNGRDDENQWNNNETMMTMTTRPTLVEASSLTFQSASADSTLAWWLDNDGNDGNDGNDNNDDNDHNDGNDDIM